MDEPIHPLFVHFPIVMLILGVIAQIIALWKKDFFDKVATYMFFGGFFTGVVAYFTGETGEKYAMDHFGATEDMIDRHSDLALWTLIVFGGVIG